MSTVLIAGGAGFVGANLALYLNDKGHKISILDNLVRRGSELNLSAFKEHEISFQHGDIRNKEDIAGNYDFIMDCSAQPSAIAGYNNPWFDFSNNVIGTMNLLEHARKTGAAMFLWSTNKVYSGDKINALQRHELINRFEWTLPYKGIADTFSIDGGQHSIYGLTKAMCDLACQEYHDAFGVKTVVNRFSCLAGPRQWGKTEQGWVSWFVIAKHLGLPVKICGWGGKQVRDVLFIGDICRLIDLEMDMLIKNPGPISGQVFNIGGGQENAISILECINMLGLKVSATEGERKGDHAIYITDNTKATEIIGWKPTIGLSEGFKYIENWVVSNYETLAELYA